MKIRRFLLHVAVTLVIFSGASLVFGYSRTGRWDGLLLMGLAAGLLLLGVRVMLGGAGSQPQPPPPTAAAPVRPQPGRKRSGRRK